MLKANADEAQAQAEGMILMTFSMKRGRGACTDAKRVRTLGAAIRPSRPNIINQSLLYPSITKTHPSSFSPWLPCRR